MRALCDRGQAPSVPGFVAMGGQTPFVMGSGTSVEQALCDRGQAPSVPRICCVWGQAPFVMGSGTSVERALLRQGSGTPLSPGLG